MTPAAAGTCESTRSPSYSCKYSLLSLNMHPNRFLGQLQKINVQKLGWVDNPEVHILTFHGYENLINFK